MMGLFPINLYSTALNGRKTVYVHLPKDYEDKQDRSYPVVYLLHGRGGIESDWVYKGEIERTIETLSQTGQMREAIFVMPSDGGYDRGTFYADWYDGSGNFEQYLVYDVVAEIDRQFRTIQSKSGRVIGGFSMGGYGAFMLALNHPDIFGAAGSLAGAMNRLIDYPPEERARITGPLAGPHAKRYNLYELVKHAELYSTRPELFFTCGTEDYLLEGNRQMHRFLNDIQYRYFYQEHAGEHGWEYAKNHVPEMLVFFEHYFHVQQQANQLSSF